MQNVSIKVNTLKITAIDNECHVFHPNRITLTILAYDNSYCWWAFMYNKTNQNFMYVHDVEACGFTVPDYQVYLATFAKCSYYMFKFKFQFHLYVLDVWFPSMHTRIVNPLGWFYVAPSKLLCDSFVWHFNCKIFSHGIDKRQYIS